MGTKYLFLVTVFISFSFGIMCNAENVNKSEIVQEVIIQLEDKINALFSIWKVESNQKLDLWKQYIDNKLTNLETNITDKIKQNTNCNPDLVDKKPLGKCNETVNFKNNVLNENITKEFKENIDCKLDASKNVSDLGGKKPSQLDVKDNIIKENIPSEVNNVAQTLNATAIAEKIPENNTLPYKEESPSSYNRETFYSMDNDTFNHVSVKRNLTNHLTYFEMHIAIKADEYLIIWLTNKEGYSISDIVYTLYIAVNSNQYTELICKGETVKRVRTPNIISSKKFRDFYIKIYDGTLEFGKEGDSSPFISYYDARFQSVNYFAFKHYGSNEASIRFDCPVPVVELPYKEETLMLLSHTPLYSMANNTFEHVTFERNSTSQGWLTYFEMHLAIEADEYVIIWLTDKDDYSNSNIRYEINVGVGGNQYTDLNYQGTTLKHMHTPNILTSTRFTDFYIKIDDGNLEFGKEDDGSPFISYYDARLQSVNYFAFNNYGVNKTKVRFDCPAPEEIRCKEESFSYYGEISAHLMDNETLKHVTLARTPTGLLSYFKIHIAIAAKEGVFIRLWNKGSFDDSTIQYSIYVGRDNNQYTEFYSQGKSVQRIRTPYVLSSYKTSDFYIKIDDGKLEFGKEGDSSPLISHSDVKFQSVNYFGFSYFGNNNTKIHFDCPTPIEALPCKRESLSSYQSSPGILMDVETHKHVMLETNSTGHLMYFKMHMAIEAGGVASIRLWNEPDYDKSDISYDLSIGINDNQYSELYFQGSSVQHIHTRNILSSTRFRLFYIKIDDGNLEFGKEGSSRPLLSYNDVRLSLVKYIGFNTWGNSIKFGYDCPAPTEGSS